MSCISVTNSGWIEICYLWNNFGSIETCLVFTLLLSYKLCSPRIIWSLTLCHYNVVSFLPNSHNSPCGRAMGRLFVSLKYDLCSAAVMAVLLNRVITAFDCISLCCNDISYGYAFWLWFTSTQKHDVGCIERGAQSIALYTVIVSHI